MTSPFSRLWISLLLLSVLTVGACSPQATEPASAEEGDAMETAEETEGLSILRPEVAPPEAPPPAPEPYRGVIGFPEGGSELDADAVAALEAALVSPQIDLGLPITLSAHSDSSGSDQANLNSSEARGLAVAQWLIDNGVDPDRITVIAFGEQNPIEPNARPDGSPSEEGRAANRRVEIEIAVPDAEANAPEAPKGSPLEGSVEAGD